MSEPADRHPPLGRASEASLQVASVLALIRRETGSRLVSLVAHSWGSMPAACAAVAEPDAVDRLVLFAPIARRTGAEPASLPAWIDVTNAAQHARFVEDVPEGHPPVLLAFDRWAPAYLASDPVPPDGRRPPCAFPTGRVPTMSMPGRGGLPGTRRTHAAAADRAQGLGFALHRRGRRHAARCGDGGAAAARPPARGRHSPDAPRNRPAHLYEAVGRALKGDEP